MKKALFLAGVVICCCAKLRAQDVTPQSADTGQVPVPARAQANPTTGSQKASQVNGDPAKARIDTTTIAQPAATPESRRSSTTAKPR